MTDTKFIMLVGIPASGKSTYAKELSKKYNANIHSSDEIRKRYTGHIDNQSLNDLVFRLLHEHIYDDLSNGISCIYDATNLSSKRRRVFLETIKKYDCSKECVIVATPYQMCMMANAQRDRTVPENVMKSMYYRFEPPYISEGWDVIHLYYPQKYYKYYNGTIQTGFLDRFKDFNQNNPHHSLTLTEHCMQAYAHLSQQSYSKILRVATILHDCGKPITITFENSKGEYSSTAHYYNHENVGAYESLFYDLSDYDCNDDNSKIGIATRISLHMKPYVIDKNLNEGNDKLFNKCQRIWGEHLFNDVMLLHKYDKLAH